MTKYISVGKILNFHGIKGEAKVGFTYVQEGAQYIPLEVENVRINKNFALFKFKGIDSINDLMEYKGKLLFVNEDTIRENIEEDEFLIDELVGLSVFDENDKKLGFVVGVSNNGASDLLSVKTNSKHICLVPFVQAIIRKVSISDKKIIINNIEGLLE